MWLRRLGTCNNNKAAVGDSQHVELALATTNSSKYGTRYIRYQTNTITAPQNESANRVLHTKKNVYHIGIFSPSANNVGIFSPSANNISNGIISSSAINHNVGIFSSAAYYQSQIRYFSCCVSWSMAMPTNTNCQ